ncbi:MAG TPA: HAD family phosphatase [Candidatus Saccharimonadales bacterium]|nr:HAD family phosphatase [Candidatus Saccharimonadales bacterium]
MSDAKPTAVVFDLGKVLVDFDFSIAARKLATRSKHSAETVQKLIDHSPLLFRYETGLIHKEQFYKEVCAATGYEGKFEEFCVAFSDIFSPIHEMIELHARLRARQVPTYIFSNTNDLAIGHIRKHYPFFAGFNAYVLSFEHGAMKPHAKLYEVVERVTGRKGPEILYLDDRLDNIETGRLRGWHTIHHYKPVESIAVVKEFGLIE